MQSRTIVVALIAAILLAAVAMLVISLPKGPATGPVVPVGDRVLDLDIGRIVRVRITGGGRTDVIRAGETQGTWELLPAGDEKHPWLLNTGSVRGMFRLIAETRAVAEPAPGAAIEAGGVAIEFELANGDKPTLRLSPRTLAGQGLVSVPVPGAGGSTERLALVPDVLHGMFVGQGVRAWREKSLLHGVSTGATGVRLVNRGGGLALVRGTGRWSLSEPVAAVADPAAVLKLLTALEGLSAVRFYDEALAESVTGLDNPTARIIVELRGGAEGRSVMREVSIGGPADATGRNVFATTDNGRTIVALDATALSQMSIDVARFLLPGAVSVAPQDVGMVVLTAEASAGASAREHGWRRSADGWVELRSDGQELLLRTNDAAVVTGLLTHLHGASPSAIMIEKPDGYTALGTVRLSGLSLDVVEEVEAGTHAGGGLVVRSGRIYRAYASAPAALEGFLGAALPPMKPRNSPTAPPGVPGPEINK